MLSRLSRCPTGETARHFETVGQFRWAILLWPEWGRSRLSGCGSRVSIRWRTIFLVGFQCHCCHCDVLFVVCMVWVLRYVSIESGGRRCQCMDASPCSLSGLSISLRLAEECRWRGRSRWMFFVLPLGSIDTVADGWNILDWFDANGDSNGMLVCFIWTAFQIKIYRNSFCII